jgi:hypothetical protein
MCDRALGPADYLSNKPNNRPGGMKNTFLVEDTLFGGRRVEDLLVKLSIQLEQDCQLIEVIGKVDGHDFNHLLFFVCE